MFPTPEEPPHTEASPGRLSTPSLLLPLPSLALHHTLALTKIDIYVPWSREHGAGLLGAAVVGWEIKMHSLCTCIEHKYMCI